MILLEIVVALQACSNKFGVVNVSVLIRVHYVHSHFDIFFSQLTSLYSLHPLLELIHRQLSVAVGIELTECLSQSFDLVLWYP
jgi:hypothetical protein